MPSDSEIDKTDETSAREKVDSSHKYTPHSTTTSTTAAPTHLHTR